METTIISLGGSLIVPEQVDIVFLKQFHQIMLEYTQENRAVIVCGGGHTCREYQDAAKEISQISDNDLDWIGIVSTKLNAELLRAVFGDTAHDKVTDNPLDKVKTDKRIIIGSGYVPGSSSDLRAVQLAKNFKAKSVINLSNTDYIFDKDPKFKDAKKIERMSWDELLKITGTAWKPGMNVPFDPEASKEARKLELTLMYVNGNDLENFKDCLYGRKFRGTIVSPKVI